MIMNGNKCKKYGGSMELLLISNQPSNRLIWQNRILAFTEVIPFNLKIGSNIEDPSTLFDAIILVLDDPHLSGDLLLSMLQTSMKKASHVVCIICESPGSDFLQFQQIVKEQGCHFIWERQFNPSAFYQMLFKPRRILEEDRRGPSSAEVTEVISPLSEMGENDLPQTKVGKIFKTWGTENLKGKIFGGKTKPMDGINSVKTLPRLKICLLGEAYSIYELGAVLADYYNQQVLVLDLDRLMPSADLYTGVKATVNVQYDFFSKTSATGINILFDCLKKGELHREAFQKASQRVKGIEGYHILTGSYQMNDFEYYRSEDLAKLVDRAAGYYDVILMKTNGFPYDGFTLKAFALSDYIVAALNLEIHHLRAYRQMVELLDDKQNIKVSKHFWMSCNAQPLDPIENSFFESLAGTQWLGPVRQLQARDECGRTGKNYLKSSMSQLIPIYTPLIDKLYRSVTCHEPSA